MTAKNDVTGNEIKTKVNSDEYCENYDNIFRKEKRELRQQKEFDEKVIMQDEYYDLDQINDPDA